MRCRLGQTTTVRKITSGTRENPPAAISFTSAPAWPASSAPARFAWPFIDQMNPDASTLALASIEVDISSRRTRHVADRQMARQAGLHPQPHRRRKSRKPRPLRLPISRIRSPATPTLPPMPRRNRSRPLGRRRQGKLDRHDRRLHPSRLRPAGSKPVSSAAGSAPAMVRTTIRPAASAKARRRRTWRCRPSRVRLRHHDQDRLRGAEP